MIYLECREADRDGFNKGMSFTFRRGIVEARHPWGAQDESCLTFTSTSRMENQQRWVYICGDDLSTYNNGDSVNLTLDSSAAESSSAIRPINDSTLSIAVCGSFMDSFNCYQIDGDHYNPISCKSFTNFFSSCIDGLYNAYPSDPLKIHLLMPYAARIIMPSLPPNLCQNHYYAKILNEANVIDSGIFSTFAYRFCCELRALKQSLRFHVYAAIGDFKRKVGEELQWETETGLLFRFNNYQHGTELTDFETCNYNDLPSHYGVNEGALIHYDFSDLNFIYIWGEESTKTPLYEGDVKPPYSENLGAIDEPSGTQSRIGVIEKESSSRIRPENEHDRYLRSE